MQPLRPRVNAAICILMLLLISGAAAPAAQPWPQRPVRLIVPIGAGTGSDIAARRFAEGLADRWKQPVDVENRPGAEGLVGTNAFAAMHDDHVLLFSPAAPISVFPLVHEQLPYDPACDIVPIASATNTFVMVAASESLKVRSLKQLVELARSRPGTLNWGSGGGALTYVLGGFVITAKLDMVEIPYREQSRAIQDLASGRLHVLITTLAALLPQVNSGKVALLAVTNSKRAPIAADVSTATEVGYPELAFEGLWGFFGPKNLAAALRDRIAADIGAVAADPTLVQLLAAIGQKAHAGTPAEFSAEIEEQREKIASIVKVAGANLRRNSSSP